jgi:hypothetical protein
MTPATIERAGQRHAVLAVDPGGTSGVFAGYVVLGKTLKETLQEGLTSVKTTEVGGSWRAQGRELARITKRFLMIANVEQAMRIDHVHLVCEDFVLRMPASTTNLTSCWVAASWATALNRDDIDIVWQQPSHAKNKATNERLKLWNVYQHTVGSEHKRDAARHFCLFVDKLL